jgi:hypothetical protein
MVAWGVCYLTGDIPAGQTFTFNGTAFEGILHVTGPTTVKGTLAVDNGGANGAFAWVTGDGGSLTVASGGTPSTTGPSDSSGAYFQVTLTVQAGGTVDLAVLGPKLTNSRAGTSFNNGTSTVNAGTFDIAHGASVVFTEGSTFTQSAGTLKVNGSLMVSGDRAKFTLIGGTESGGPVDVYSATVADGPGTIGFDLVGICTLTGDIPAGQTVTFDAVKSEGGFHLTGPTTVKGTLAVDVGGYGGGDAWVTGGGSLTVASGGTLRATGPSDSSGDYIQVPLTNEAGGTVDFAVLGPPPTDSRAGTSFDNGTSTVNSGTFDIAHGASVLFTEGSTFTQSAGTLKVGGSLMVSGDRAKFILAGGTESGGPVHVLSATLVEGPGTIGFDLTGICTLTGDIPAGQTVTLNGRPSNASVYLTGLTTVKGALVLAAGGSSYVNVNYAKGTSLAVGSGGTLSTTAPSDSSGDYIQVPLTVQAGGKVDIAASTDFADDTPTVNAGTFDIAHGGQVVLGDRSTLTNKATGTLGVTVDAKTKTVSGITGPGVALNGKLAVTTMGSSAVGYSYVAIGGPVTGRFSSYSFGHKRYSVRYTSGKASTNEVLLTFKG